ncbi:decapping 5-like [Striga asiatica]|uniref:Decapping 5-like n=1 Tax=Striga asiatica TaxID=4170 RepID=A0A5A7RKL0_STRAF|nr:decapping 5-like [Striga asiatica]
MISVLFHILHFQDLQVITAAPVQTEEPIYNDPAIIQVSNSNMRPLSSSKPVSPTVGSLPEYNLYAEPPAPNAKIYQNTLPSYPSETLSGLWGTSHTTHNTASSYGMQTQWQGYSASNIPYDISHVRSSATSSSIYLTATPTLSSEQLSTPYADPVPSKPSLPVPQSTLISSNGLTMPSLLTYQNTTSIEPRVVNKVALDPASLLPVQSFPNSVTSVPVPIVDPQQVFLTPNLSQPKLTEHSLAQTLYPDQKDITIMSSANPSYSSPAATAVQPPLLPLPPHLQKSHSLQFTEEFDFQAMNEKFNKDEVWGYLGKANQREKVEGMQENGMSTLELGDDNPKLTSKTNAKPAYNKDDFFDSISCNSVGRGTRNGHNWFSERMKLDSQTLGSFQRRTQFGYGGHRESGVGEHHGSYNNRQRGHNYGHRGHEEGRGHMER